MRVIIAGPPRTGKTTLAADIARALRLDPLAVQHTDELVGVLEWSEASAEVATWFTPDGPWVVEGVATVRALRKWLAANDGKPADRIYWLAVPRVELTRGQDIMTRGTYTVWESVFPTLRARGVPVFFGGDQ